MIPASLDRKLKIYFSLDDGRITFEKSNYFRLKKLSQKLSTSESMDCSENWTSFLDLLWNIYVAESHYLNYSHLKYVDNPELQSQHESSLSDVK